MKPMNVDRMLLVFSIWCLFGFGGIAFVLEGFARDSFLLATLGTAAIVGGFVGHVILNAVFGTGFTQGETALGIGVFGVIVAGFAIGWVSGGFSDNDVWSGLTLIAVLALGLPAYLSTRYGVRGAFSQFHMTAGTQRDERS